MDTVSLLHTRRSVKAADLVEPGPDAAALEAILAAATRVPDHGKLAPWHIQVLHKDGQAALGEVFARVFRAEHPDANDKQIAFERARPQRAPLLLAVTAKLRPGHKIPEWEQILSGGAVCTLILVAAQAQGYAGQWLTEWPAYRDEVVRALGHDPVTDRILGFMYLGTAANAPEERARPERETVVSVWAGP